MSAVMKHEGVRNISPGLDPDDCCSASSEAVELALCFVLREHKADMMKQKRPAEYKLPLHGCHYLTLVAAVVCWKRLLVIIIIASSLPSCYLTCR